VKTLIWFPLLSSLMLAGCTGEPEDTDTEDTEMESEDSEMESEDSASAEDINPCNPNDLDKPPIWAAMTDLSCDDPAVRVQSAADVTRGSTGEMTAELLPLVDPFTEIEGMCAVNVHWHLGAEHRNTGTFDLPGAEFLTNNFPDYVPNEYVEPGNFCPEYDENDPKFTTEYDWQYCGTDMKVGYTYEIHWPHSNLGACNTDWQYQTPFMNGVLCAANEADLTPGEAVASVFETESTMIGVQAQVFTIVNDEAYDYPAWNMLEGWNTDLANDVAIYQGSTTGLQNGNETCRASGGMVSWHVGRECNLISARAFDELCRQMKMQRVDMAYDTYAHNSRETTDAAITSDIPM